MPSLKVASKCRSSARHAFQAFLFCRSFAYAWLVCSRSRRRRSFSIARSSISWSELLVCSAICARLRCAAGLMRTVAAIQMCIRHRMRNCQRTRNPLSSRAVVARVPRAISQPTRLPLQPPSQFLKVRICVERRRRDIHRQPGAPPQEARHRRHERWKRDSPLERVIWNQKSIHGIEARLQRLVYGRRDWILGRCPRLQHETAPLGAKQIEGETIQSLPQAADRLSFLRSDRWRCLPRRSLDGASRESGSTP